jgi:hypothetical protein
VVAHLELGVGVVVQHPHQQARLVQPAAQLLGLCVPGAGRLHRSGQAERVGQLGPVPDLHVGGGLLVEQFDGEHRVLQALGGVAEQPVDVGPDQVGSGLQLGGVVVGGPLLDLPDQPGGAGQVAATHHHVRDAEPGAVAQRVVTEPGGLPFHLGGAGQGGDGVPEIRVLDRQQRSRKLLRADRALVHHTLLPPHCEDRR